MEALIELVSAHAVISAVVAGLVGLGTLSVIASLTPSPTDDKLVGDMWNLFLKLIHTFGLNSKGKGK